MNKRDEIAAIAMCALIRKHKPVVDTPDKVKKIYKSIARGSYNYADAMIAASKK